jgi:hypothetical protein
MAFETSKVTAQQIQQAEFIDRLGLKNKEIEPVNDKDDKITRNLQLGNIPKGDFKYIINQIEVMVGFESIPNDHGGWLTRGLAQDLIMRKLDRIMVSSLSIGGFLRKNLNTDTTIQKLEQTNKRRFGLKRSEN